MHRFLKNYLGRENETVKLIFLKFVFLNPF